MFSLINVNGAFIYIQLVPRLPLNSDKMFSSIELEIPQKSIDKYSSHHKEVSIYGLYNGFDGFDFKINQINKRNHYISQKYKKKK